MKNLILFIIFILTSCSSSIVKDETISVLAESEKKNDTLHSKYILNEVIIDSLKKPRKFKFITIGNLDIMKSDLGFFDSKQADIECQKLGDGWRLPTEAELNVIYEQNDKLGTFKTNYYLGLGYEPDAYNENGDVKMFLRISIINGEVVMLQSDQELFSIYGVRAVRDHKL